MTAHRNTAIVGAFAAFAIQSLFPGLSQAQPGQGAPGGGFGIDPRAESRTYKFEDTGEDMSYCVYVSSKVDPDEEAPLIMALHGMGATPDIMCNSTAVDLAEERGYILAAPMGYNTTGWFGSPVISFGAGRGAPGGGRGAPGAGRGAPGAGPGAPGAGPGAPGAGRGAPGAGRGAPGAGRGAPGGGRGAPPGGGMFGGGDQPENLAELSEKDVMNVLAIMRDEFTIDEDRIYLTGHSMGGAGTYFLGSKYSDIWAAIAPVAPAAFMMTPNRQEVLQPLADNDVPVMVVHGDVDEVVNVSISRDEWVPTIESLGIEHEYVEIVGSTHGPVIYDSQEYIFDFFDQHSK